MGGFVAYEFALDHPDRALSLVLIDSAWRYDPSRTSDFQTRLVGYITTGVTDLDAGLRAWTADALFVPASGIPSVKNQLEQIVLVGHLAQGPQAFFVNGLNAVSPTPLAETHLADLSVPTLVMVGELDDPEFLAHSDVIAGQVPNAEKVVIAGAGHMSPMERPDDVNQALTAFLEKH